MKLNDAYDEFINSALLERCLEQTTIDWYSRCIQPVFKYFRYNLIPLEVDSLTVENLRKYFISYKQKGNTSRTVLNAMQGTRSFCSFLLKRGYLQKNPFLELEKPKLPKTLPEFLDEEEAKKLLQACINLKRTYKSRWSRDIAIIALFLFAGLRKKELLNLKLNDFNQEKGYIKVSAKNKERLVPLCDTAKSFLLDYLKIRPKRVLVDNIFVSTNRKSSALTQQGLYDLFLDLRKLVQFRIKKKLSPQILRHTFCTLMLRNGVNLRDIQLLAGHSDISTTARFYLGCDEKQLKSAVDRHPLNI
ncbi:MAG TPA: tyrosine-type recombinase/integrase [Candidatus Omnitrophota bacterium]|nr:tyrosine-type recombinase/integrase [Candidatus Omnitrophota bacterium]HPD85272.1 tyrosine-type recombinase/integrase [Candidatus Omnitrophota bacterium]HRZ04227.1 tyrosine-type recombinase/integrase [Candidatus Omnitrophota bacterium]